MKFCMFSSSDNSTFSNHICYHPNQALATSCMETNLCVGEQFPSVLSILKSKSGLRNKNGRTDSCCLGDPKYHGPCCPLASYAQLPTIWRIARALLHSQPSSECINLMEQWMRQCWGTSWTTYDKQIFLQRNTSSQLFAPPTPCVSCLTHQPWQQKSVSKTHFNKIQQCQRAHKGSHSAVTMFAFCFF